MGGKICSIQLSDNFHHAKQSLRSKQGRRAKATDEQKQHFTHNENLKLCNAKAMAIREERVKTSINPDAVLRHAQDEEGKAKLNSSETCNKPGVSSYLKRLIQKMYRRIISKVNVESRNDQLISLLKFDNWLISSFLLDISSGSPMLLYFFDLLRNSLRAPI